MTKKEKVKKFFKEHDDEIRTGVKLATGIVVAFVIGKKLGKALKSTEYTPKPIDVKIPTVVPEVKKTIRELPSELTELGFEVYSDGPKWIEFADYVDVPTLGIEQMHEAVDAIKKIPGFNENSGIQAMFNVYSLNED